MGMTMTQKILAAHAGLDKVEAGQLISAKLDIVLGNDITTPVAVNEFKKAGFDSVFDKDKVAIVLDHFVPNKDIKAAEQSKTCREFACAHCVSHFYDVGKMGIEHALLPEQGVVTAGDAAIAVHVVGVQIDGRAAFHAGIHLGALNDGLAVGVHNTGSGCGVGVDEPTALVGFVVGTLKVAVTERGLEGGQCGGGLAAALQLGFTFVVGSLYGGLDLRDGLDIGLGHDQRN